MGSTDVGAACTRAREGLWPPERPRLAQGEILQARAHVEGCAACQEYFRQDRLLLDAYDLIRGVPAPRTVKDRVFDRLAAERVRSSGPTGPETRRGAAIPVAPKGSAGEVSARLPGASRRWVLGALAAAMVAAVVVSGHRALSSGRFVAAEGSVFVEDYLRRAVGEDHVETSDPAYVARFLERELGMALAPIAAAGLRLTGAEICLLEGRRGAMIKYVRDGQVISHYLVPRQGARPRSPALLRRRPAEGSDSRPVVVTWATASVEQALVGGSSPEELLRLARGAVSQE